MNRPGVIQSLVKCLLYLTDWEWMEDPPFPKRRFLDRNDDRWPFVAWFVTVVVFSFAGVGLGHRFGDGETSSWLLLGFVGFGLSFWVAQVLEDRQKDAWAQRVANWQAEREKLWKPRDLYPIEQDAIEDVVDALVSSGALTYAGPDKSWIEALWLLAHGYRDLLWAEEWDDGVAAGEFATDLEWIARNHHAASDSDAAEVARKALEVMSDSHGLLAKATAERIHGAEVRGRVRREDRAENPDPLSSAPNPPRPPKKSSGRRNSYLRTSPLPPVEQSSPPKAKSYGDLLAADLADLDERDRETLRRFDVDGACQRLDLSAAATLRLMGMSSFHLNLHVKNGQLSRSGLPQRLAEIPDPDLGYLIESWVRGLADDHPLGELLAADPLLGSTRGKIEAVRAEVGDGQRVDP